jgi:hypothetical protein
VDQQRVLVVLDAQAVVCVALLVEAAGGRCGLSSLDFNPD